MSVPTRWIALPELPFTAYFDLNLLLIPARPLNSCPHERPSLYLICLLGHSSAPLPLTPNHLPNKRNFTGHLNVSLKWQVKCFVSAHTWNTAISSYGSQPLWLQNKQVLFESVNPSGKPPSALAKHTTTNPVCQLCISKWRADWSPVTLSVREEKKQHREDAPAMGEERGKGRRGQSRSKKCKPFPLG